MKILDLPLKAKWYNMIESGVKTEEYREIKPYWERRFCWHRNHTPIEAQCPKDYCKECYHDGKCINGKYIFNNFTHVRFRYGYTKRTMLFELKNIRIGKGKPEWGAPDATVFILELGNKITE